MELDAAEPMQRDGMVDPSTTDSTKELPPTSLLREPVEQASAAFVLDYLRHHGYTTALESTRTEMKRREWISAESPATSASEQLTATHEIVRNLLDTTAPIDLERLDRTLQDPTLMNHARVLQLVLLIRKSQQVGDGDQGANADGQEGDMDEAIEYGKTVWEQSRRRGQKAGWDSNSLELLDEASGYIGVPMTRDQVALWDKRRVSIAGDIEKSIRSTCLYEEMKA
jgi:hypothetical protein